MTIPCGAALSFLISVCLYGTEYKHKRGISLLDRLILFFLFFNSSMYNLCCKVVIEKILSYIILPFADTLKLVSSSYFFQYRVLIGELIYLFVGKRFSSPSCEPSLPCHCYCILYLNAGNPLDYFKLSTFKWAPLQVRCQLRSCTNDELIIKRKEARS